MKTKRARYTLEYKQEAVRLVESGQSIAAAARSLGNPAMCAAGARLHSPALPLQRSHRRSGAGEEPEEVDGALQGGTCVWSDEAEVRIRQSALPGTGEERQPIVCHLRSGESVPGTQEAAVLGGVVSSNSAPTTECASRRG